MLPAEPGNGDGDEDNDGDGIDDGAGDGDGIDGDGFRSKSGRLLLPAGPAHSFTPQSILSGGKYLFRCSIGIISSKLF